MNRGPRHHEADREARPPVRPGRRHGHRRGDGLDRPGARPDAARSRAADQCGGNIADCTYPARAFQFDDAIAKWIGVSAVQFNDDMTLTVTPQNTPATVSGGWELHEPNGPNPAKNGVVTFCTTVSPAVQGDGVANIYWYVGYPNCNPTAADPAKKLFQIVGDVQTQPV